MNYGKRNLEPMPVKNEGAKLAIHLLREVMRAHCDEDSPDYNRCEISGEECQWCSDADKAIKLLSAASHLNPVASTTAQH